MSILDFIMGFEAGELSPKEIVEGFSRLRKENLLTGLQGMYQRYFRDLVEQGYLNRAGDILRLPS